MGGGIGMGNTCTPMAVSFQCMTKSTTNKKKKKLRGGVAGVGWGNLTDFQTGQNTNRTPKLINHQFNDKNNGTF